MFDILSLSWTFYGLLAAIPLLYWFLTKNHDYFAKRGIKGPKPLPLFGNFLDNVRMRAFEREEKYFNEFGKIYGVFRGQTPVLTVCEPDLIKQLMVKDFHKFIDRSGLGNVEHEILKNNLFAAKGDQWRKIRSLVTPTFTTGKMKKMRSLVNESVDNFLTSLKERTANGRIELDVKPLFGGLTMEVIANCAFATKINSTKEPDHPFPKNASKMIQVSPRNALPAFILPKFVNDMIGIKSIFDNTALNYILDLVRHIIKERKNSKVQNANDFLQLLINAENVGENYREDDDKLDAHYLNEGEEEVKAEKKVLFSGKSATTLTENEMIAQAQVFLVAGYETTATSLTWAAFELALNPSAQDKLHEEIVGAQDLDYDTVARLSYLDAVIAETLRLHNPALRLVRVCEEACQLGDIEIPVGFSVEVSVHAVHHCEEFHPEPYKFKPERFLPENRHLIKPYTYLPFGVGPRSCVGMRFALMEAKMALAHVIKHFRFVRSDKTNMNPESKHLFLNIPQNVVLHVERR